MNRTVAFLMLLGGLLMIIDGVFFVDISAAPSAFLTSSMASLVPPSTYLYVGVMEAFVGVFCEAIFFLVILTAVNRRRMGLLGVLLSLISLVGGGGFILGFILTIASSAFMMRG